MKKQRYWSVTVYVYCGESAYPHSTYNVIARDDVMARAMATKIALLEIEAGDDEDRPAVIAFCETDLRGDIYYYG